MALALTWAALSGCKKQEPAALAIETRKLPGFEIALPAAAVIRTDVRYQADTIIYRHGTPATAEIRLEWLGGAPTPPADFVKLQTMALTAATPMRVAAEKHFDVEAEAASIATLHLASEPGHAFLTAWRCGGRDLSLSTMGPASVEELHRRMLASFRCRPDPVQEAAIKPLAVKIDLPVDFGLESSRAGRLLFASLGGELLSFGQSAFEERQVPTHEERRMMQGLLGASGLPLSLSASPEVVEGPDGPRHLWRASGTDDTLTVLMMQISCPAQRTAMAGMYGTSDSARLPVGEALLSGATCADPAAPAPSYRSAAEVFAAACAAGDARGCKDEDDDEAEAAPAAAPPAATPP
jgi:plasmid stability protein